jgi:hypothetical protein
MEGPAGLSVAEAATASGFTRQAIYRAIKDGRLGRWLIRDSSGHARLVPEAVKAIRSGVLMPRVDTAAPAPPPAPAPAPPNWDMMAPWANALLDSSQWGPPPWLACRWATLEIVSGEAEELFLEHGEFTAEKFAALEDEGEDQ